MVVKRTTTEGVRTAAGPPACYTGLHPARKAGSDAHPRVPKVVLLVVFRLQPVANAPILFPPVRESSNFIGCEDERFWGIRHDAATDDQEVTEQVVEVATERDRAPSRKGLHLKRVCPLRVLAIDQEIDPARVSRGGHDVPTETRQPIGDEVQADVTDDLLVQEFVLSLSATHWHRAHPITEPRAERAALFS